MAAVVIKFRLPALVSIPPVSYTHLDVYKRQIYDGTIELHNKKVILVHPYAVAYMSGQGSVSYTHLTVWDI